MTGGEGPRGHASPPCLAAEIAPDYFDPLAVDAQQATDVARWRKARRAELLAARAAAGVAERQAAAEAIARHLDALLAWIAPDLRGPDLRGLVVAGYWPIRAEPDLRPWLIRLHNRGARIVLPVAERPARPMTFRPWAPGAAMERGHWNIPVPATTEVLTPAILIAPLVGRDDEGYRLGHGGGYYDRTLAALRPRPFAIGTGLEAAALPTIFPQPHDVRMDAIVTENGLRFRAE